jgi:hypothetical protein
MTLETTHALLYLVLAIGALWVAAMLAWLIGEAAMMMHQANQMVRNTREKIGRVERAVLSMKEKMESSAGYLGTLATGGKMVFDYLKQREQKGSKKKRRGSREDEE